MEYSENNEIERLLSGLGVNRPVSQASDISLQNLFEKRISELKIAPTNALDILNMERRTLNGLLAGQQKRVDFTNFIKLSDFLQISLEEVFQLYVKALKANFAEESKTNISVKKVQFIKSNFDLAALKNAKFIDSISDFERIEEKIVSFFGLNSIMEYERPSMDVAFSAGKIKPKNELSRAIWINAAKASFEGLNNPYEYDRKALIDYFPNIRWHTTNVELGLISVIRDLFRIGVTVIYQEPLPSLHLRGATFAVNDKPCVVLTNYVGFYPTLWFALIHELYHVLFDWEEISMHVYHLSEDEEDDLSTRRNQLTVREKEREADDFARKYLLSQDKMENIRSHLHNAEYIKTIAEINHVHSSFVYVFNAYDVGNKDRMAWARARKNNPPMDSLITQLANPWDSPKPINEFVSTLSNNIYT